MNEDKLIEVLEKIERQLHSIKNHLFGIILALGAIIGVLIYIGALINN